MSIRFRKQENTCYIQEFSFQYFHFIHITVIYRPIKQYFWLYTAFHSPFNTGEKRIWQKQVKAGETKISIIYSQFLKGES